MFDFKQFSKSEDKCTIYEIKTSNWLKHLTCISLIKVFMFECLLKTVIKHFGIETINRGVN